MTARHGFGRLATPAAALLLVLPLVAAAGPALGAEAPLHVFRPGAAGEPAWAMLELEVSEADVDLDIQITWTQLNCPFTWGFILFEGLPEDARPVRGITFDYVKGHQGAEAHAWSPIEASVVVMNHTGTTQQCNASSGWTIGFPSLSEGTFHLLAFAAGTPFAAEAVVSAPDGGIRLVATSSGERTFYVRGAEFESDGAYVAAHSPGFCVGPNLDPESGFCAPGHYWHGGSAGGAELGWGRSATLEFQNRPFFRFGLPGTAGVSNATVTDPLGHVIDNALGAVATVAGLNVYHVPETIVSMDSTAAYAPGPYRFDVNFNADVGVTLAGTDPVWHVAGADYLFPAEE